MSLKSSASPNYSRRKAIDHSSAANPEPDRRGQTMKKALIFSKRPLVAASFTGLSVRCSSRQWR
jgi:hypothetical protein